MRALLLLSLVGVPGPAGAQSSAGVEVTVFAAASLGAAFEAIAREFERANPGARVRLVFAGSQQLAVQLEHGARADLFASADLRWVQYLAERRLLAGSPRVFARNRLVAIVPRDNPAGLAALEDLARPGVKLVLAADAVPAGRYARQALDGLARLPGFAEDYRSRVARNVVSEEETVKAVVAKVQLGEADAGIVYASDVNGPVADDLGVLPIPDQANVRAEYPLAVLREAAAPAAAEAFARYLLGAEGQRVLRRYGFESASPEAP